MNRQTDYLPGHLFKYHKGSIVELNPYDGLAKLKSKSKLQSFKKLLKSMIS